MNKLKNAKFYTKLLISFGVIDLLFLLTLLFAYNGARKSAAAQDTVAFLKTFNIQIGIMAVVITVIMSFIGITLGNVIRFSFTSLQKAANDIADGKTDVHVEKKYEDEFGALVDDFRKVIETSRYHAQIAELVANGNMAIDVKSEEEDVLGNALAKLVEKNQHSLSNIKDAAMQVSLSSTEVSGAAESLAQGSTQQASAIEEITASIIDIAEKTRRNANEANRASTLMAQAIADVRQGNEQMEHMTVAMSDINKSSEGISKIIKVIDDIAFQTNILALNAAVEAARAGDAGKGFAVVAEEVRNLAAKSLSAAAETAEMIEDSIQKVSIGSDIAKKTAQALEMITKNVKECETMISGIAEASNYQATAIAQIDQAIEQVSQVVQTNSATSEECAAASVELSRQADRMTDLLAYYRLDHSEKGPSDLLGDFAAKKKEERDQQFVKRISLEDDYAAF